MCFKRLASMIMELARSKSAIQVQRPEGWRFGDESVLQVTEGHLPAEVPLLRESVFFCSGFSYWMKSPALWRTH